MHAQSQQPLQEPTPQLHQAEEELKPCCPPAIRSSRARGIGSPRIPGCHPRSARATARACLFTTFCVAWPDASSSSKATPSHGRSTFASSGGCAAFPSLSRTQTISIRSTPSTEAQTPFACSQATPAPRTFFSPPSPPLTSAHLRSLLAGNATRSSFSWQLRRPWDEASLRDGVLAELARSAGHTAVIAYRAVARDQILEEDALSPADGLASA